MCQLRICCQKQVSQAGISNYIPQFTVGWNYLSPTEIPASGNKVLNLSRIFPGAHWLSMGLAKITRVKFTVHTCKFYPGYFRKCRLKWCKVYKCICFQVIFGNCDTVSGHWDRVTHICVSRLTSVGSNNDLSPGRRQAIIWTNAGILLIGPIGTIFSENVIEMHIFSFKKTHLKMSSGKWHPICLGLNVLMINPCHIGFGTGRGFNSIW